MSLENLSAMFRNRLDMATPVKRGYDAMQDSGSIARIARVYQLKQLYAARESSEISPFDDGSADIEKFLRYGLAAV